MTLKVISLGWGVQSWVLAAMVRLGELEPVDFVIHSDTTWERSSTYDFASKWTPWLEEGGVRVVTVNDAEQAAKVVSANTDPPFFSKNGGNQSVFLPAYSRYESVMNKHNGVDRGVYTVGESVFGQLRRQCTHRWKIKPMRQFIANELKRQGLSKQAGVVEQWLGITLDEIQRAKDSDVKYIKHRFPLLEKKMTRTDCLLWLQEKGLPSPGKSACVFCPYHRPKAWQKLKRENGPDWETAKMVDRAIRDKRPPYPLYVHEDRKPLEEAVTIPEDFGLAQLSLLEELESNDADAECDSGYCFL